MGIPKFFYYCYNNYPEIMSMLKTKQTAPQSIDFVYFDLNAIIHKVCQSVFEYGQDVHKNILIKKNMNMKHKTEECFVSVCKSIENYVNICRPKKGVYVAIDGVCGMAKCNQQRQRRFKSSLSRKNSTSSNHFDPNCISPGTEFMDRLSKRVSFFLKEKIQADWSHLELILSNEKVVGEGEHKCIKHIRDNPTSNSIVCSPDADLFMLLLSCHDFNNERKLYIIRENIYDKVDCMYFVVDVNKLADIIINRVSEETNNIRKTEIITDFVFFCFFLGNDFLPSLPCVDLNSQGMDTLFDVYSLNLKERGTLFHRQAKRLILNKEAFISMLRKLAEFETRTLSWKIKNNKINNDPFIGKCMLDQDGNKFDMEKYRKMYYKSKFGKSTPSVTSVRAYIEGLLFVLYYYFDEIPSYTWFYSNHYAPFALDIADVMERHYKEDKNMFIKHAPMLPLQQLFCILPPSSSGLLPESLAKKMNKEDKDIGEWMSMELELDSDFKHQEWEYVLLISGIDQSKFMEVFTSCAGSFSQVESKRNVRGVIYVYYTDGEDCYIKEVSPSY